MVIQRGEIWWASLDPPVGSAPGKRRPVLIIQSNDFNSSSISTVVVASITSNTSLADSPGNVRLSVKTSKLKKPSVVNVSQILTIDKSHLTERISKIPHSTMSEIDVGMRLVLSLFT